MASSEPQVRMIGEPVWARMKGYKPWPGKVATPTRDLKDPPKNKKHYCVFFFGTFNYSWIPEDCIISYGTRADEDDKLIKTGPKGVKFKEAVDQIYAYFDDWVEAGRADVRLPEESPCDEESPVEAEEETVKPEVSEEEEKVEKKRPSNIKITPIRGVRRGSGDEPVAKKTPVSAKISKKRTSSESNGEVGDKPATTAVAKRKRNTENGSSDKGEVFTASQIKLSPKIPKPPSSASVYVPRPATPPLDVHEVSDSLKSKKVQACTLKFGFLGLGNIGQGIVKNLLNSGHDVTVWNRTPAKTKDFAKAGARVGLTPGDVVAACDVVFCCVASPDAAKEMVFGNCGVLSEMKPGKGYVEMTTIDPETSRDINEAIQIKGGRYLEAPICGYKSLADKGELVVLACGDKPLFDDCSTAFQSMSRSCMFVGENVGNGSKMNLFISVITGSMMAAVSEALALVDASEMSQKDFVDMLENTCIASPFIIDKCKTVIEGKYAVQTPLQHMQKDLQLAIEVANKMEQPLQLASIANEQFKNAKRHGYGEHDMAAVYIKTRR